MDKVNAMNKFRNDQDMTNKNSRVIGTHFWFTGKQIGAIKNIGTTDIGNFIMRMKGRKWCVFGEGGVKGMDGCSLCSKYGQFIWQDLKVFSKTNI